MIPVHQPVFGGEEMQYVMEALEAGEISGTAGRFITEFEDQFADYCECNYGVAVNSGTAALHIAAVLSNIKPGDEVVVSACTNIASANAIAMQGGVIAPVDSEPDTWNMDVHLLKDAITARTRAIMPVHIYGHPVDMDEVLRLAKMYNLFVIEDCAEAHGATYWDRKVGSFGNVGCFSFYANKVITTGEGGMLVTNDRDLANRARSLRNLSFTTPRFKHNEIGFNYRMTNVQAAIGLGQLSRIESIIRRKRFIADLYTERLSGMEGLRLPVEKDYARNVYWMYGVVVENEFLLTRDELADELRAHGVDTRTMFCPMNLQPSLLRRKAVVTKACPVAETLWESGLYLPSGCSLTEQEIDAICGVIEKVSTCA